MEDAFTRRNHPAWRGTRRARRPRAHGSAEASPAQHHCTLRARSLMHSLLDAVQSGVANANHHCSSTADICTTTPSMHTRGGTCRASASTLACKSPRNPLPVTWPRCSVSCSATRSPHCSALPVACCAVGLSSNPPSSACLWQASSCSSTASAPRALRHLHSARQQATDTIHKSLTR